MCGSTVAPLERNFTRVWTSDPDKHVLWPHCRIRRKIRTLCSLAQFSSNLTCIRVVLYTVLKRDEDRQTFCRTLHSVIYTHSVTIHIRKASRPLQDIYGASKSIKLLPLSPFLRIPVNEFLSTEILLFHHRLNQFHWLCIIIIYLSIELQ